ncbi:MAG: peptidase M64 [Acidimicrobiia bacterium]|nr:peptidase M64 [Acidimicrobiia bacterium]
MTRRFVPGTAALLVLAFLHGGGPGTAQSSAPEFDRWFTPATMRLDYVHVGGLGAEQLAVSQVVGDGPWPGSRTRLVDDTDLGTYRVDVLDARSGTRLYSRGFSSVYAEWETTAEAAWTHKTFRESVRFPWPQAAVEVAIRKRVPGGGFRDLWSTSIDPRTVAAPAHRPPAGAVWTLVEHGPPAEKVDLLLIAEGYTRGDIAAFHADAERLVEGMFALEPYRSRRTGFNVRALDLVSPESGVRGRDGAAGTSRLATQYGVFGMDRYLLSMDDPALRDAAAAAPYEFIAVVVNERSYGGGGIFNAHATVAAGHDAAPYVFVHEFAHHFAGLGDEYYSSEVSYETGGSSHPEPWEPNLTALADPAALKWRDLVKPGTPLPTPWDREGYERLGREHRARRAALDKRGTTPAMVAEAVRDELEGVRQFLAGLRYAGTVGAFEGAGYQAEGLYRPSVNCVMFTRDPGGFCPVCRRAISRIIDLYAGQ